jgi:hypothetical protein
MSLLPETPKQKKSPASLLMADFAKCTKKQCRLSDFTKLLKKSKADEVAKVIEWCKTQPPGIRDIPSSVFLLRYDWLREQATSDLSGYPVSEDAQAIAIETGAQPEYVQHTMDTYSALLSWLKLCGLPDALVFWERLLPPRAFALHWFTNMVPGYSKRYQKFEIYHPKFQQYMLRLAADCSTARTWIKLTTAYENDQ